MSVKNDLLVRRFKYPFYPTKEQKVLLTQTFGCCRFVYNRILDELIKSYEVYKKNSKEKIIINDTSLSSRLTFLKFNNETEWLNEVSGVALQQSVLDLVVAFKNFFREKKGYPRFKKKSHRQTFNLTAQAFRRRNDNNFYIPKSDQPLKINFYKELPSEPTSATIILEPTGEYFISFVCKVKPKLTSGTGKIGIDLGIKDFAVLSTGGKITNPKYLEKKSKHLKHLQRILAKKKKGSKNFHKARIKVARLHRDIANARSDFLHKLSRRLVNENQVIGIEGLRPSNMVKNHKLAKAISSASWGMFKSMLIYKTVESQHCNVIELDQFYPSSHICHKCLTRLDRKLKLSERYWVCPECGEMLDRDTNAANNIRNEAIIEFEIDKVAELGHGGLYIKADAKR